NHFRYLKLNDISSNYVQWLTETKMTEFPTTHVFHYDEDTKDKTITIGFTGEYDQKVFDCKKNYDELNTIIDAHNAFVTYHKDYFPPESIIKFNASFAAPGRPEIAFMSAYDNAETMATLGESYDNIIKFAYVDLFSPPNWVVDDGCSFDIPNVIIVTSESTVVDVPDDYDFLKAFSHAKRIIINSCPNNHDKDVITSNVKKILPNSEVIFIYLGKII
ncbi:hypothetical protein SAMN05216390_11316, partial [Lachnospiraceae bacterium KH1T2]